MKTPDRSFMVILAVLVFFGSIVAFSFSAKALEIEWIKNVGLIVTMALLIVFYQLDKYFEKKREILRKDISEKRVTYLMNKFSLGSIEEKTINNADPSESPGIHSTIDFTREYNQLAASKKIAVRGCSMMVPGILCLGFSFLIIMVMKDNPPPWNKALFLGLAAIMLLIISIIAIIKSIPFVGKPTIVLTQAAFYTPTIGWIDWSYLKGVTLKKLRNYRWDWVFGYELIIYIPQLKQFQNQFHPIYRSFQGLMPSMRRSYISLILLRPNEDPTTILTIMQQLYRAHTSTELLDWDPALSNEVNNIWTRIQHRKRTNAFKKDIDATAQVKDHKKAKELFEESKRELNESLHDLTMIRAEGKKYSAQIRVAMVIAMIGLLASLVVPLCSRLIQ